MASDSLRDPERLRVLRASGLLEDPSPEEAFDRLARLAARLLAAPMAAVSLVDGDAHLYKGAVGLPEALLGRRLPLSRSLCSHVVEEGKPLLLGDVRDDPRTGRSAAVREPGAAAYAGVPLVAGGEVLGTVCVMDSRPRSWTEEDAAALSELALAAASRVEWRAREAGLRRERQAALAARDRFYGAISHELRTPISAVILYNDLLLSGACGPLTEAQRDGVERSQSSATHLLEMVNAILELSSLDPGKVEAQAGEAPLPGFLREALSAGCAPPS